jgi:hypothetical protein
MFAAPYQRYPTVDIRSWISGGVGAKYAAEKADVVRCVNYLMSLYKILSVQMHLH